MLEIRNTTDCVKAPIIRAGTSSAKRLSGLVGSSLAWAPSPRLVAVKVVDPFQLLPPGHRPEVHLAVEPAGQRIREQRLKCLGPQRILHEGLDGRGGGSKADMVLRDAEDDDGEAAEEDYQGPDAGDAEGEPRPEPWQLLAAWQAHELGQLTGG